MSDGTRNTGSRSIARKSGGLAKWRDFNTLADAIEFGNGGPPIGQTDSQAISEPGFWFKITGSTRQKDVDNKDKEQWAYAGQEVYKKKKGPGNWTAIDGGITTVSDINADKPVGWNTLEDMNGLKFSGATGSGYSSANIPGKDEDTPPLSIQPIATGAIVWARLVEIVGDDRKLTVEVHFTVVNQVDGTCPTDGGA